MAEQNKLLPRPIFRRDMSWEPFPNWTQPSRIFAQDFGLPPLLEPGDIDWLDWAKKRLASFAWPGYPLLPPLTSRHGEQDTPQVTCGVSEIQTGENSWKISLDVNHFTPEEITITTKDGYLQISGTHEERQDKHGVVSRCFSRKYKLPPGADLQHISSALSDGVLSVEAPVSGASVSNPCSEIVVPVLTKQTEGGEKSTPTSSGQTEYYIPTVKSKK